MYLNVWQIMGCIVIGACLCLAGIAALFISISERQGDAEGCTLLRMIMVGALMVGAFTLWSIAT
jgi:hypothetical protein